MGTTLNKWRLQKSRKTRTSLLTAMQEVSVKGKPETMQTIRICNGGPSTFNAK